MKKRTKPEVRPVGEYPIPGYPSHRDPEPKAWLQVNPYPFGGTIAGSLALGALGLLGVGVGVAAERAGSKPAASSKTEAAAEFCALCSSKSFEAGKGKCGTCGGDSGSPQLKHCSKCAGKKSICRMCGRGSSGPAHPFSLKRAGLPARPIHFKGDVAMPSRINERDARGVIEKLYKAAGVELAGDAAVKLGGAEAELDGWDAKKKIGFEFLTYGDIDHSGKQDLSRYSEKQRKAVEARKAKGVSASEMRQLERLSLDKKAYVAVINHEKYPYENLWSDPKLQAKYKELRAAGKDKQKRKKILAEINKLRTELNNKAKQKTLKKLETDVRTYLTWLKKQGAL